MVSAVDQHILQENIFYLVVLFLLRLVDGDVERRVTLAVKVRD
jgi:hypothetical protein